MAERFVRLAIDPRPAQQGAREYERAIDGVISSTERMHSRIVTSAEREVDVYRRAAREREQTEREIMRGRSSQHSVSGSAAAEAFVRAQESVYQANVARIKEAQARGLMSPAEARSAGQQAALEYNQAILGTLDRRGAYRSDRGAFTTLAGSIKNIDEAGRSAGVGMHRLNNSLVVLARQATGAHPILGQLTDVVGTFAIGTAKMVPILAGVAALGFALRAVGRDAREAKEELEGQLGVLRDIAKERGIEARGGEQRIALQAAQEEARTIAAALRAREVTPGGDLLYSQGAAGVTSAAPLRERLRELNELIRNGLAEIGETEAKENKKRLDAEREFQEAMAMARLQFAARGAYRVDPRSLADLDLLTTGHRQITGPARGLTAGRGVGVTPFDDARLQSYVSGVSGSMAYTNPDAIAKLLGEGADGMDEIAAAARVAAPLLGDFGGSLSQIASGIAAGGVVGIGSAIVAGVGSIIDGLTQSAVDAQRAAVQWERAISSFANAFAPETALEEGMREARQVLEDKALELASIYGGFFDELLGGSPEELQALADMLAGAGPYGELSRKLNEILDAYEQHVAGLDDLLQEQEGVFAEDLNVRLLRAQGLDEEADALALAIKHERELAEAREIGYSDATIDLIEQVHAEERLAQAREAERDAINAVTEALNSPRGLNLALLTWRAGLTGGSGGIDGTPFLPPPSSGPPNGPSGVGIGTVTINVNGATDPRETADVVMARLQGLGSRGGPDPFTVVRR